MGLKLDWKNSNSSITKEIRIYRSTTPIVDLAGATPLVTLPNTAVTYTDPSPPVSTVTYYQLVFVGLDNQLIPCSSQPYGYFPNGTGPGRQDLLRGTWSTGYFGTVPVADVYTPDELRAALGTSTISGATILATNARMTVWHKFVFEGKILFYPQAALISNVRWSAIYNKGWMYGVDGPGPALTTTNVPTPVNQKTLLVKGAFTYRVRTPKGLNKPVGQLYPSINVEADLIGSEWDQLVSNLFLSGHRLAFNTTGLGRLESLTFVSPTYEAGSLWSMTQHVGNAGDASHVRGGSSYPDQDALSPSAQLTNWVPVLQLEFV